MQKVKKGKEGVWMTDIGEMKYFLGIEVDHSSLEFLFHKRNMLNKLQEVSMHTCKAIPLVSRELSKKRMRGRLMLLFKKLNGEVIVHNCYNA